MIAINPRVWREAIGIGHKIVVRLRQETVEPHLCATVAAAPVNVLQRGFPIPQPVPLVGKESDFHVMDLLDLSGPDILEAN